MYTDKVIDKKFCVVLRGSIFFYFLLFTVEVNFAFSLFINRSLRRHVDVSAHISIRHFFSIPVLTRGSKNTHSHFCAIIFIHRFHDWQLFINIRSVTRAWQVQHNVHRFAKDRVEFSPFQNERPYLSPDLWSYLWKWRHIVQIIRSTALSSNR